MSTPRRLTEDVVIQLVEPPTAASADATVPSTYIDVSEYYRFAFYRFVGSSDDTSVTMQVVQATAAVGTGSKDVDGAAITATSIGSGQNNKWAGVEVEQSKLDINNGFRYVAVTKGSTGGAATASCIIFCGWQARNMPVTQGSDKREIVYVDG